MKQIIPFKKDIIFKTKIFDITSISLEHKLEIKNKNIFLEFLISGDYKMTETSINKEEFSYNLPFELDIDKKYDISDIKIDIDDFYYEIINSEILRVNISILLDNLSIIKEKKMEDLEKINLEKFIKNDEKTILDLDDNISELSEIIEIDDIREDDGELENERESFLEIEESINDNEILGEIENNINTGLDNKFDNKIFNSLFSNLNTEETFKTYHIYIMREEDTIEKILIKYGVTKELLEEYNNIDNIKIGDKIIIPNID